MRDSQGRIFQERRTFVPKDSSDQPQLRLTEISDPLIHARYVCRPGIHVCDERGYFVPIKMATVLLARSIRTANAPSPAKVWGPTT